MYSVVMAKSTICTILFQIKRILAIKKIVAVAVTMNFRPHFFFICQIKLHLGEFQSVVIRKKIEPEPKLCKIIKLFTSSISVKCISIRMEVNSGQKHQLIHYDYHSNGFLPKLLCMCHATGV